MADIPDIEGLVEKAGKAFFGETWQHMSQIDRAEMAPHMTAAITAIYDDIFNRGVEDARVALVGCAADKIDQGIGPELAQTVNEYSAAIASLKREG